MGFFKKIFKGVKKGFKSIGKGIKSAFKKFGKFMGKIGILGQIAMMFIMPGIGGALMKGLGGIGSGIIGTAATATTAGTGLLGGALGNIGVMAGKVMQGAANFVGKASNVFRNVTEGVTNFVGEFSKTAANKLSSSLGFQKVPFADASSTFFSGGDSAWAKSTSKLSTRMGNLTASKDTIKALDSAAQSMRTLGQPAGLKMSPVPEAVANPLTGKLEVPNKMTDSLLATPPKPGSLEYMDNLMAAPRPEDIVGPDVFATPDTIMGMTAEERAAQLYGDTSWTDKLKSMAQEGWDKTVATAQDEFVNFGSNTIKRVAGAPVAGIEMGLQSGIQQRIAGELNPQEPVLASRGAAALQMYDIGETNAQIYAPQANYGSQMGAMPYGYGAMQSGYQSFLKSSIA